MRIFNQYSRSLFFFHIYFLCDFDKKPCGRVLLVLLPGDDVGTESVVTGDLFQYNIIDIEYAGKCFRNDCDSGSGSDGVPNSSSYSAALMTSSRTISFISSFLA